MFFGAPRGLRDAEDMKALGLSPGLEGKRVVVQGFGNVGYHAAKFCREGGAIIVGVAERDGAISNPKGLDVEAVHRQLRKETKSIRGLPRRAGTSAARPTASSSTATS